MIKRIILGIITILAALPGLLFIIFFIGKYHPSLLHWLVVEKIVTALFCFVGGILLFKGDKWGYRLALIGWLLIIWASSSSVFAAFQPITSAQLRKGMLTKEAIILAIGVPTAIVMIREIVKTNKV
jgi:hypothetical protein